MLFAQTQNVVGQNPQALATEIAESAKVIAQKVLDQQKELDNRWRVLYPVVYGSMSLILFVGILMAVHWFVGNSRNDLLGIIERLILVLMGIITPLVIKFSVSKPV